MDENKELLEFIYEASDMGKHTVTSTLSLIKDKDNSDAAVAGMIMQGLTMGVVETSVKIDNYKDIVDKKSISLANDFLKFQESSVENLKKFL